MRKIGKIFCIFPNFRGPQSQRSVGIKIIIYSLSLAVHHSARLLLLLLLVVTILRTEVDVLVIMVTVLLESVEVIIGDNTDVVLVSFPRSSEETNDNSVLQCCLGRLLLPGLESHVSVLVVRRRLTATLWFPENTLRYSLTVIAHCQPGSAPAPLRPAGQEGVKFTVTAIQRGGGRERGM